MTSLHRVVIRLRQDRRQVGSLSLIEIDPTTGDRAALFQCDARGKADNARADRASNQHRNPRQPFGDTPAGAWEGCRVLTRAHARENDGIGARWIPLPYGQAADDDTRRLLDPKIKGSRSDLGIHGGRGNGDLIATNGCVRLRDQDFARLAELLDGRAFDVAIIDAEEAGS